MKVSVITCARYRHEGIGRLVRSIRESTHPDFELLIVDQSGGEIETEVLAAAEGDRRVRFLRLNEPVRSKAMNHGVRQSTGAVLAFTNDLCEPRPDWLEVLARLFCQTTADIICGKVSAPPYDVSTGYICEFDPGRPYLVTNQWCSLRQLGVGANMAMRRSVFARVGYFDECIGPGGIIPSGDDRDFLYRAVRVGCRVLVTPDPEVIHHDYRSWEEDGWDAGRSHSIGLAVPYAKFMRRRDPAAFYHYLSDFLGDARHAASRVARMRRPLGINRLRYYLEGAAQGFKPPLDPGTMVFRKHS